MEIQPKVRTSGSKSVSSKVKGSLFRYLLVLFILLFLTGCDRYNHILSNIETAIAASRPAIRPAEVADVLAVEATKVGEAYIDSDFNI